ncbi:PspA-associated protein PspAA [Actinocatenispora rupis]|uniref:PspA-associated domain-containing protein n=1 Tax=Actinocatenispora rupis TaxID=519421 RepID=A0A8J3J0I9_9ACTN|nr:hypothetical protein [Actinocatenispora rupis]GID12315.1 hypothetical protein Aru02nite_32040 [Actinocatenispora rupis]
MIVRILGEGQYDVPPVALDELNVHDDAVQEAADAGDEGAFTAALASLLDTVRARGTALDASALVPSELILPAPDAPMAEVQAMLGDEGLIPG